MYSGSVGIGGTTVGIGVVAGSAVTGNLPTTGFASIAWAILAVILIFGGLILIRLAALRRAGESLTEATASEARAKGLQAALGIEHGQASDTLGTGRVE